MVDSLQTDLRRQAWRKFYLENYPGALNAVGQDKRKIDAYIKSLWKTIGSKGREAYIDGIQQRSRPSKNDSATCLPPHASEQKSVGLKLDAVPKKPPKKVLPADSSKLVTLPGADGRPQNPQPPIWPRKLASRLCRCVMLARGKKILLPNETVSLIVSKALNGKKGKNAPPVVVRLVKNGREVARLDSPLSYVLGPAMQSGLVCATCTIVQAPASPRMFSEFFADVGVFLEEVTFASTSGTDESTENDSVARMSVVQLIQELSFAHEKKDAPVEQDMHPLVKENEIDSFLSSVNRTELSDAKAFAQPRNLVCTLREYQKAGIRWMAMRERHGISEEIVTAGAPPKVSFWRKCVFEDGGVFHANFITGMLCLEGSQSNPNGLRGGILADEMGLGKTVQCIACILCDLEEQACEHPTPAVCKWTTDLSKPKSQESKERFEISNHGDGNPPPSKRMKQDVHQPNTLENQESVKENNIGVGFDASPDAKKMPTRTSEAVFENFGPSSSDEIKKSSGSPRSLEKSVSMHSATSILMKRAKGACGTGGTLIVCPMSLLSQWIEEFSVHVRPKSVRVLAHYGHLRRDRASISSDHADVVITSYGVLASEFNAHQGSDQGADRSPLCTIRWRRIILDEAHTIKSRTTLWARAAYCLKAERRWCVTGTVIHNHVTDLFSLLHFLRLEPWSSWKVWNQAVVNPLEAKTAEEREAAMAVVRDILSSVALRRKKSTTDSHGAPIIRMTKKHVEVVAITPSADEQDFYASLHAKTRLKFNSFMAQGSVMRNYASVLEMLLRLRQACDHPYLVVKHSQTSEHRDAPGNSGHATLAGSEDDLRFGGSVKSIEDVILSSMECQRCLDLVTDIAKLDECGHHICRGCIQEATLLSKTCPLCETPLILTAIGDAKHDQSLDTSRGWKSSAKIDELIKDLEDRRNQRFKLKAEIGKSVVFSQFTSMLDLVEVALKRGKLRALRIDGSVPQARRALILKQFRSEPELDRSARNILLVSLKTGGVGLNLTAASFAVLLDIHWNPQIDSQAEDRIHRHGQKRDVHIKRYIIKGSIEEKLLDVQARKMNLANGALEEASDGDRRHARLSELKMLLST